jgi:hypothetical protein
MPQPPINYLSLALVAVGATDETTFYSQPVSTSLLVNGANVLAAEVHQANGSSSDVSFDLTLTGDTFAPNLPPSANAGADQTVTLPASAALAGSVSNDGLPVPPGLLTFSWSKFSGPGMVTFANPAALSTSASFSFPGAYVLRLAASDGSAVANDDVSITVNSSTLPLLCVESVGIIPGSPPVLSVGFTAMAGQTYTIQYGSPLAAGTWLKLKDIPAQSSTQLVEVTNPLSPTSPQRFYRNVTPQQP